MARAARLLRLVQVLRRYRAPVSAAVLADELEVSQRSIYRDVQTLRAQGASIDGEAGVGYVLRPGFLLPPLMFSDEEFEALVLGLRLATEHGDQSLGLAARDAVAKLRAVVPKDMRSLLDEVALLAGPAQGRATERIDLAAVRRSIREQRKVRIGYVSKSGVTSERVIWPLGLAYFERARLVVAYCETRRDFRSFRADRISSWVSQREAIGRPRMLLLRQWREREKIPAQLPD